MDNLTKNATALCPSVIVLKEPRARRPPRDVFLLRPRHFSSLFALRPFHHCKMEALSLLVKRDSLVPQCLSGIQHVYLVKLCRAGEQLRSAYQT